MSSSSKFFLEIRLLDSLCKVCPEWLDVFLSFFVQQCSIIVKTNWTNLVPDEFREHLQVSLEIKLVIHALSAKLLITVKFAATLSQGHVCLPNLMGKYLENWKQSANSHGIWEATAQLIRLFWHLTSNSNKYTSYKINYIHRI